MPGRARVAIAGGRELIHAGNFADARHIHSAVGGEVCDLQAIETVFVGRADFPAKAEIEGQPGAYFPVVLNEE